ncbi:MAG TPA: tetratricopeptide repeat protein [Candidatus Hydrogenedentes bacterium]|nr:tetratricopeptide repeat protein [Candidatus Hydrogenedentota bacterium]
MTAPQPTSDAAVSRSTSRYALASLLALLAALICLALMFLAEHTQKNGSSPHTGPHETSHLPPLPHTAKISEPLLTTLSDADAQARQHPSDAERIGRLASLYGANGFPDEAAQCFLIAAALAPEEPTWSYYAAVFCLRQNNSQAAEAALQAVRSIAPAYAPAAFRLADIDLGSGNAETARQSYETLQRDPALAPFASLGLAQVAIATAQWETAIHQLKTALAAKPRFDDANRLLDETNKILQGSSPERLHEVSAEILATRDIPDPWLDELAAFAYDPVNLLDTALRLLAEGRVDQAQTLAERAISLETHKNADYYYALGNWRNRTSAPENAVQAYQQAIEQNPFHDDARISCAETLRLIGQFDEAASHFQNVVDRRPDDALLRVNLGFTLKLGGRHAEALEEFRKAEAISPDDYFVNINLATVLIALHRPEEAMPYFEKARAAHPESPDPYASLANAYLAAGNLDDAQAQLDKLLAMAPHHPAIQQLQRQLQEHPSQP